MRPRLAGPHSVALVAVGVVLLLVVRDPHRGGSWAQCPTLWLTGHYCPGCGSLRAVHDLATGRVVDAIDHNLLAIVALGWLGWAWAAWVGHTSGRYIRPAPSGRVFCWLLLAGVAAFTVVRNLPGSPLAP